MRGAWGATAPQWGKFTVNPDVFNSLLKAGTTIASDALVVGGSLAMQAKAQKNAAADAAAQAKLLQAQANASEAEARRYSALTQSQSVPLPVIGVLILAAGIIVVLGVKALKSRRKAAPYPRGR